MKCNILLNVFILFSSLLLFYRIENILDIYHINALKCQIQSSLFAISFCSLYSYIVDKISKQRILNNILKVLSIVGKVSLETYCLQIILENLYIEKIEYIFGATFTNIVFIIVVVAISYIAKYIIDCLWIITDRIFSRSKENQ